MPPTRAMPPQVQRTLRRAAALEDAAHTAEQRRHAVLGTATLLLAARDAGWRISELAAVTGLKPATVGKRIRVTARRRTKAACDDQFPHTAGLDIPAPWPAQESPKPPSVLAVLKQPVEQRDWLSLSEAHAYARVSAEAVRLWRRNGLLPHTRHVARNWFLYHRHDLTRVMEAPRYHNRGASHAAVRAAIAANS